MSGKYERIIMHKLVDKYENSKSFTGDNKVKQRFVITLSALFPTYADHANYEVFQGVNETLDILVRKGFVIAVANPANVYKEVQLQSDKLEQVYEYIGRKPKGDINQSVIELMERYQHKNQILNRYCSTQCERIKANKSIQFFNNDVAELKNILIAVEELLKVENETFVRDFSVRIFRDSKKFEKLSSKVVNLLYEYGDFPDKESLLANLNLIKNPTYVNFKGASMITLNGQRIDLSKLSSDIGISSTMLADIEQITVLGKSVITIENMTSFHSFCDSSILAIYLGGYHNGLRREFIKQIYQQNPNVDFYHFGDIDAGGFYILEHLKRETGVAFKPYKMDVDTLKAYNEYTKELTENDRERLSRLMGSEHNQVIKYMIENNCKLEQEAIDTI